MIFKKGQKLLLSLDLSTTASGYAFSDIKTGKILGYGVIEPDYKPPKAKEGIPKLVYPQLQLQKMRRLCNQMLWLFTDDVEMIVIEEINRGLNRIGQKILDSFHFLLLNSLTYEHLMRVRYFDSDAKDGWRSAHGLKLQLSEVDKAQNKVTRNVNKKRKKGTKKLPVITQKHLACRFVNNFLDTAFDVDKNSTDSDICDALGLNIFTLIFVLGVLKCPTR